MRVFIALMLPLALPALADEHAHGTGSAQGVHVESTADEQAWQELQTLAQDSDFHVQEHLGIKIKDMSKFRAFAAKAEQDLEDFNRGQMALFCKDRSRYESDVEAAVTFFEDLEAGEQAKKGELLRQLYTAFEPSESVSFFAYTQTQPRTDLIKFDRTTALRNGDVTASEYADRACGTGVER